MVDNVWNLVAEQDIGSTDLADTAVSKLDMQQYGCSAELTSATPDSSPPNNNSSSSEENKETEPATAGVLAPSAGSSSGSSVGSDGQGYTVITHEEVAQSVYEPCYDDIETRFANQS